MPLRDVLELAGEKGVIVPEVCAAKVAKDLLERDGVTVAIRSFVADNTPWLLVRAPAVPGGRRTWIVETTGGCAHDNARLSTEFFREYWAEPIQALCDAAHFLEEYGQRSALIDFPVVIMRIIKRC